MSKIPQSSTKAQPYHAERTDRVQQNSFRSVDEDELPYFLPFVPDLEARLRANGDILADDIADLLAPKTQPSGFSVQFSEPVSRALARDKDLEGFKKHMAMAADVAWAEVKENEKKRLT